MIHDVLGRACCENRAALLAAFRAQAGDLDGARDALQKFIYLRPPMSLSTIAENLRFMHKDLLDRYIEGLRLAGMT